MIDSNALAQIGGTLRASAEADQQNFMNAGSAPWSALRLKGRYNVDKKRREVDERMQYADAILLQNQKENLRPFGQALLADQREQEYAADTGYNPQKTVSDFSAPTLEELRAINQGREDFTDEQLQKVIDNWDKGQLDDMAWSRGTGEIFYKLDHDNTDVPKTVEELKAKNPHIQLDDKNWKHILDDMKAGKAFVGKGTSFVWTPDGYVMPKEMGKDAYYDWVEKRETADKRRTKNEALSDEERRAQWFDERYGSETPEERKRKEDEIFEADFKAKMMALLGNDESRYNRFFEQNEDPRFFKFDPSTGLRILKRPDEIYYDLGNYANYWAPEMAPPYYGRAETLTNQYGKQFDKALSVLGQSADNFQRYAEDSETKLTSIDKAVAEGRKQYLDARALLENAQTPQEKAQAKAAMDAATADVLALRERIRTLRGDAEHNHDLAREAQKAQIQLGEYGPLNFMNSQFAGGALINHLYGNDPRLAEMRLMSFNNNTPFKKLTSRVENPTSLGNEEVIGSQRSADATRDLYRFHGEGAENRYAAANKQYAQVGSLPGSSRFAGEASNLDFQRNVNLRGRKGQERAGAYSLDIVDPLRRATGVNSIYNALHQHYQRIGSGNVDENFHAALSSVGVKNSASYKFNADDLMTLPLQSYVDIAMAINQESERAAQTQEAYYDAKINYAKHFLHARKKNGKGATSASEQAYLDELEELKNKAMMEGK